MDNVLTTIPVTARTIGAEPIVNTRHVMERIHQMWDQYVLDTDSVRVLINAVVKMSILEVCALRLPALVSIQQIHKSAIIMVNARVTMVAIVFHIGVVSIACLLVVPR